MNDSKFEHIWDADVYDETIKTLIPHYDEILETLISLLPYSEREEVSMADLGCGTGTLALKIKSRFPHARITCLDYDREMIEVSKKKLNSHSDIIYVVSDFSEYEPEESFDAVFSSLALHHIQGSSAKRENYSKIFRLISPGGIFINADVVAGPSKRLEKLYLQKWVEFEQKHYSSKEIHEEILSRMYHPGILTPLKPQLDWLQEAGFINVDVVWKYFHYAVFRGKKPKE